MVARWRGCDRVPTQVSTGNRTRATIKVLPSPHHPPSPLRTLMAFLRLMPIGADKSAVGTVNRPLRMGGVVCQCV